MNIFNTCVAVYFLVILVLVNCSLFFCDDESFCLYPMKELPISRELAYVIRIGISNLIPLEFKTIQLYAQWIVLLEAGIVFYFIVKIVRSIVSFACDLIFLAVLLALVYLAY